MFDKDIWNPWPGYPLCSTRVCGCGSSTERTQQSSSVSLSAVCEWRGPRGYVPGKDFTAVCWMQTRQADNLYWGRFWRALPFVLAYFVIRWTRCEDGFERLLMEKEEKLHLSYGDNRRSERAAQTNHESNTWLIVPKLNIVHQQL